MFAAYNAGEQAVKRDAMRIAHTLPLETRDYVPAFLAAVHLLGGTLPKQARSQKHSNRARGASNGQHRRAHWRL